MAYTDGLSKVIEEGATTLGEINRLLKSGHLPDIGALGAVFMVTKKLEEDIVKEMNQIHSQPALFSFAV